MAKKKISRIQDAEIKKQLRSFAKKEYSEKKPLEIRVLQLKPGVVFKKGSMLPNLMIKNLTGTAYVIYLDYGDKLKFYYFAKNGMSMGGSNFDKSEKLLKEMHGKAKSIYKLPKIEHEIGLEKEIRLISDRLKKFIDRSARKFGLHIRTPPSISIKKNISSNNIRIGIFQQKDFMYFDYNHFKSDLQDPILFREIFPILTKTQRKNETIQLISTMWALTQSDSSGYIKKLKEITPKRNITKKTIDWIIKGLLPYLGDSSTRKEEFAEFLIKSCIIIEKSKIFNQNEFFDIFLIWLMEYGKKNHFYIEPVRAKFWLYYELLKIYYFDTSLYKKYDFIPKFDPSYPLIHLCCRYFLEIDINIDYSSIDSKYSQFENALRNLNFPGFLDLIPEPILKKNKDLIHEVLYHLLKSRGIKAECGQEIEIPINSEKIFEVSVENRTDWSFDGIEFFIETFPKNKINIKELDHLELLLLRDYLTLKIKIQSLNITGKCDLKLKISFRDPLNQKRREILTLKTINVRVSL
jgi:hypothetical protein